MISEKAFAAKYTSFWNEILPRGDAFMKMLNLSCDRFNVPIDSKLKVDRNKKAFINELSFRMFKHNISHPTTPTSREELIEKTKIYISKLSDREDFRKITVYPEEVKEAENLSQALSRYFGKDEIKKLEFWPRFKGCGIINSCKGDILLSNKLIEVKAGDRTFRLVDLRQVITYLSLNYSSKERSIDELALVNPRTGLHFTRPVSNIVKICTGRNPVDVFSDIIEFMTFEINSK